MLVMFTKLQVPQFTSQDSLMSESYRFGFKRYTRDSFYKTFFFYLFMWSIHNVPVKVFTVLELALNYKSCSRSLKISNRKKKHIKTSFLL